MQALPSDVVLGMLRSRGILWTEEELQRRYIDFSGHYIAWQAVAAGKSYDGLEIRMMLANIFGGPPLDYTQEQIDSWRAVQESYAKLQPVWTCIEAYGRVLAASMETGAISAVPLARSESNDFVSVAAPEVPAELTLLRLTCSELRRVPIGRTLRTTLEIAATDAAAALREQIKGWTDAAQQAQSSPFEAALKEIAHARKELATASTINRVGSYITVVGATATALSLPGSIPLASGISVAATFAGAAALASEKYIQRRNRWAMFGQI